MPYSKISESRIKKLDGVKLTLSQVNRIAAQADALEGKVENPWAVAISSFKKGHTVKDGKWTKKQESEKSLLTHVEKEGDRYKIVAISTAAVRDKEEETFSVPCIDYDITVAKESQDFPEFRVFHNKKLGVGKVTDMSRVGIFAVDVGYSYTDKFSLEIMKMLEKDEEGKWRVSRGFYPREVWGHCPTCDEGLLLRTKHLIAGFRCPSCDSVYLDYRGILKDVHFLKAKTFDVSVTDVPAVGVTGVAAFPISHLEESIMTKEELKKRLKEEGVDEDAIDERLKSIDDKVLKQLGDDIPTAQVLKELELELEEVEEEDDVEFALAPEALKSIASAVSKELQPVIKSEVKEAMDGMTVEVPDLDMSGMEVQVNDEELTKTLKEVGEKLDAVIDLVEALSTKDEERLKEMLDETPRRAKALLRIKRFKDEEDDVEEDDEENVDAWLEQGTPIAKETGDRIVSGDGRVVSSLQELVFGEEE